MTTQEFKGAIFLTFRFTSESKISISVTIDRCFFLLFLMIGVTYVLLRLGLTIDVPPFAILLGKLLILVSFWVVEFKSII